MNNKMKIGQILRAEPDLIARILPRKIWKHEKDDELYIENKTTLE